MSAVRTVEVDLTLDDNRFVSSMAEAGRAVAQLTVQMRETSRVMRSAGLNLAKIRHRADLHEIRVIARRHRAELAEHLDGLAEAVYADLNLTRPPSNIIRGES
jgi:hypothetical protein